MGQLFRKTIIGGIIFLIPVVALVAVIGKALDVMSMITGPLTAHFSMDRLGAFAIADLLALALLVLICFGAGLLAGQPLARRLVESLESRFLAKLPPYALLKAKTQTMLSAEDVEGMVPVVVRFDDSWQMAFEIERIQNDKVALFLPGSPDPWAGSVCVVTTDRVNLLDVSIPVVAKLQQRLGRGTKKILHDRLQP
jgi:uncharacterized membrane protein